jgi:hypothetical protein
MNNRRLTLIIPDLMPNRENPQHASLIDSVALRELCANAVLQPLPYRTIYSLQQNLWQLSQNSPLPVAALTAKAFELPDADCGYWLRADPTQLRADLAGVYLLGNAHLAIQNDELTQIGSELAAFLQEENIQLHTVSENIWLLQLKSQPQIHTTFPDEVLGKEISQFLPTGREQQRWRMIFTQIQMLLHDSAVNLHREQMNWGLINGLWLWGEGELPSKNPSRYTNVITNDPVTIGLAKHFGVNWQQAPLSLQKVTESCGQENADILVVDTTLKNFLAGNDLQAWQDYLSKLGTDWLQPLRKAIKENQYSEINLYPSSEQMWRFRANNSWFSRLVNKLSKK